MKIKKGDKVQVMLGKDRGKTGTIERVLAKSDRVLIPGLNLVKRHVKRQGEVEGGVIDIAKPVDISNIQLVCPSCHKVTRVGFLIKEGKKGKVRVCRKCNKQI